MVFVKTKVTFPTPARETADIPQNFINFAVPWPFTFPMPPVETSGLAVGTTRPCPPAQSCTLRGLFLAPQTRKAAGPRNCGAAAFFINM